MSNSMAKQAILVHGWEGTPWGGWRPWLKKELEKHGFKVIMPAMPETDTPTLEKWLSHLQAVVGTPDEQTYFVGHSLGCITILRLIESLKDNEQVGGAVLVAGFGHNLEYEGYKNELISFFANPVDWEKIKKHCKGFVALHSDNDPWVPIKHNQLFKEKLGAEGIIEHNKIHYGDDDNILEVPTVLASVLKIANM